MKKSKIKIMILMGGPSAEHEISLRTGEQIKKHLHPDRYEVTSAIIGKDGRWMIDTAAASYASLPSPQDHDRPE